MRISKSPISLILLISISASVLPGGAVRAQQNDFSSAQVALEQALVMKYLADEYFLKEQRADAKKLYEDAQKVLDEEIAPDGGGKHAQTVELLRAELEYRLFLVKRPKMDFWGARYSLSIVLPLDPLRSMQEHMGSFTKVVKAVRNDIDNIGKVGAEVTANQVNEVKATAEANVTELQQQGAQTEDEYYEERTKQSRERLDQIVNQTRELQQRQSRLVSEMNSVEKNLNGAVLSAISASAGLPVDLGKVANGASLRDTLISAAASAAGSPEFKDALRDVHSSSTQIMEVYEKANDVLQKVQQTKEAVHTARDLIRKPTFERLHRMGGIIYNRLDPQARQHWEQVVRDNRPLIPLLEVARGRPTLQAAFRRYLESAGVNLPPGELTPARLEELVGERVKALAAEGEASAKGMFDELMQSLPEGERSIIMRDLVQQNIGLAYAADNTAGGAASSAAVPGSYERTRAPSGEQAAAAMQSVFLGAATAIVPQAAYVRLGLEIVNGINKINDLADKLDDIAKQRERYMVEEVHLRDLIDESGLQRAIAQNNKAIARVRSRAALRELELWNQRTAQLAEMSNLARRRILYRMSILFYLAERLREDFDRLDRSVGIWTGAMEANRGNLKKKMMENLQTLRLALDRDIHLYDWIVSERDVESRRDDVDRLFAHWEKVSQLSKDMLAELHVTEAGGNIGSISQVGGSDGLGVDLSSLVPKHEWERFRKWQSQQGRLDETGPSPKPFTLSVLIHPEGVPGAERLLQPENGLRVVTVRLGVRTSKARKAPLVQTNQIKLFHPGFAYVPVFDQNTREARYVKELYTPLGENLDPPDPARDRSEDFRKRWRPGYTPEPFEGYGLYTTWFVEFQPYSDNYRLEDVRLKFIYQYYKSGRGSEVQALQLAYDESFAPEAGLPFKVESKYLKTLGPFQEVRKTFEKWRDEKSGEQPWLHGSAVTQDAEWGRRLLAAPDFKPADTSLDKWLKGAQR